MANVKQDVVEVKWRKCDKEAQIPSKRDEDAGYDLYAISSVDIKLRPSETKLFHIGLVSIFDKNVVGIIKERGSTGALGLSVRSGVIDSGYRGEWKVCLTNLNKCPVIFTNKVKEATVKKGLFKKIYYPLTKAIAQVIFIPIGPSTSDIATEEDIKNNQSQRQDTGWGASGK